MPRHLLTWLLPFVLFTLAVGCDRENRALNQLPPREPLEVAPRIPPAMKAMGQLVYVPVYSSIQEGQKGRLFHLSAHLSVRNISQKNSIVLAVADYYDSNGKQVRRLLEAPVKLGPMASTDFFIRSNDLAGVTGASFLVEWEAENPTAPPVVQAVMLGTNGGQGISFVTNGLPVDSH
ncbi:MAG: DUF3124 domain-containing protein [bacterium]|nr:DUF3124 domain-containing protein [bacterium]